jgi:hypothetical protein
MAQSKHRTGPLRLSPSVGPRAARAEAALQSAFSALQERGDALDCFTSARLAEQRASAARIAALETELAEHVRAEQELQAQWQELQSSL